MRRLSGSAGVLYVTVGVLLVGVGAVVATGGTGAVGTVSGELFQPKGLVVTRGVSSTLPVVGEVVLTNRSSRAEFTGSTDSGGNFSLVIPPGNYLVTAHSGSVKSCVNPSVRVTAGSSVRLKVEFLCAIQ